VCVLWETEVGDESQGGRARVDECKGERWKGG
jgi:hypothetical protein